MSFEADRTAVNYDTVTQAAVDVRNTAKNLSEQLESLMRRVKAVAETWEGEAKTAYVEIQRDSGEQMDQMSQKLARIAQLLDESVIGYQDTDKGNAARFRMLMG
ncbi:early secretory antigenic target protein ESAT-6 [Streptomyces sp. B3I7]|jgi:6 kDa early secretory antigenic target|uniref:WXG100 family type VII secretion target n=1 Tax=unclassified Streptomyces TaxID=2593676 RepID=UPI00278AECCC|nr:MULTISPECIES: WXG100 family type VII secretion target [unclassified Streptomyces]MDQ0789563.1 early secretory antigenic target protein ESAT-6 [Streptomyces sp. B3I8]MDQ0810822.1 early secretory antigenic target protein ESAT-6 [Streptomyces sp. B3I7]